MITLEQYFARWDPMDFIKDLDAPEDVYSLEARTVVERYNSKMTPEEVGELTYAVFVEMIEVDFDGFKEEALRRGEEIKGILSTVKTGN